MSQKEEAKDSLIYSPSNPDEALRQGEILSGIIQLKLDLTTLNSKEKAFIPVIHPLAIIVSQDCDLDFDFKRRRGEEKYRNKEVPNILLCEVTTALGLRNRDQNISTGESREINSKTWGLIENNKHERYHFLQKVLPAQDALGQGLEELAIDFKRYFTIPSAELYEFIKQNNVKRRCVLNSPYKEHLSTRFFYFQYRVALPEDHESE